MFRFVCSFYMANNYQPIPRKCKTITQMQHTSTKSSRSTKHALVLAYCVAHLQCANWESRARLLRWPLAGDFVWICPNPRWTTRSTSSSSICWHFVNNQVDTGSSFRGRASRKTSFKRSRSNSDTSRAPQVKAATCRRRMAFTKRLSEITMGSLACSRKARSEATIRSKRDGTATVFAASHAAVQSAQSKVDGNQAGQW